MFRLIGKKFRFWTMSRDTGDTDDERDAPQEEKCEFSDSLWENLERLHGMIAGSSDVVCRRLSYGGEAWLQAAILFIDGMADLEQVNEAIRSR
jgi:hypothetical protein